MKRIGQRFPALVLTIATTTGFVEAQDRGKLLEQEAKRQVGNVATLCGTVVAYQCQQKERTSLLVLENPSGVAVEIAQSDRSNFGSLYESRHVLLNVCATGLIEKRRKRYVVRVKDPAQVQALGDPVSAVLSDTDAFSPCEEGVEKPKLVTEVKPAYTRAAFDAGIAGVVLLEADVLTNGQVGRVRVLQSLDSKFGLDDQAVKTVRLWRFSPGTFHGQPVPVVVTIELSFRRVAG